VPVENLYRCPRQAGQDRLVNAYAAIALYGTPLVVVDFGTAITFDVISKKGKYRGGMILPGLQASLDILAQRTALLPKVNLSSPGEFIGRDSRNGMLSGIIYGYAGLTKELIRQIRQRIGKGALAIGTGGNINLMRRYCRIFDKIDRDLTLRGLYLIYKRTRGVA
jgi:type III pantothenate kinase